MDNSCCLNPGANQTHDSQGSVEEIGGLSTYKTGQGKSAIVLFTDVFGYAFPNTRKVADRFAQATGATVFIPDYFYGDPLNINLPNYRDLAPEWFKKHPVAEACPIGENFISTIKGNYESIQVIGFCYGAKVVVYLISQSELSSVIKAAVVGHPSLLIAEEAVQIKRPMLFLCAESDHLFPPELKSHFEKILTENGLGIFHTYPGTVHGFVTRPDGSQQSNEQSEKSIQDAIDFFKKNI